VVRYENALRRYVIETTYGYYGDNPWGFACYAGDCLSEARKQIDCKMHRCDRIWDTKLNMVVH